MPISPGRQPIEPDTHHPKDPIHAPHNPERLFMMNVKKKGPKQMTMKSHS